MDYDHVKKQLGYGIQTESKDNAIKAIEQLTARITELEEKNARLKAAVEYAETIRVENIAYFEKQLEVERMRLTACDVAATGYFDGCNDEHKSAALTSVLSLRERAAKLEEDLDLSITQGATINLLKQTLVKLFNGVASAPVASGICCCGDDMTKHSSAFICGHSPVDMWDHFLVGWKDEIDRVLGNKEKTDAELAADTNPAGPGKHGELASPVAVGQPLGNGQDPQAGNTETVGDVVLTDTFRGDDSNLIDSIASLIELDREGALVPHGIGGHARALLESAAIWLKRKAPALCEDEGCPHHGTPHICVTSEKEVFQPAVVWYYPDDGGKVIPASLDFLNERQEATGKAVPISDYKLAVELTAKYIYSGWKDQEGYKEWVENGNSNKQEEARQFARVRLSTVAKLDCCEGRPQWGHAWNCPKLP